MKERPILFSAPMVRALLDGSKTQTRRIIKPQPNPPSWCNHIKPHIDDGYFGFFDEEASYKFPYGVVGDRLWVRETWRTDKSLDDQPPKNFSKWPVKYEADGAVFRHGACFGNTDGKTRVSIHMPRWASRITLALTGVRVERLQDISEADAKAEGAGLFVPGHGFITQEELRADPGYSNFINARQGYQQIWSDINGADSWDLNPWVWVIEFKRLEI